MDLYKWAKNFEVDGIPLSWHDLSDSEWELLETIWMAGSLAERERWQARVEQAFREGYWARETYNDSEVSDADEKWSSARAGLLMD